MTKSTRCLIPAKHNYIVAYSELRVNLIQEPSIWHKDPIVAGALHKDPVFVQ